MLKSSFRFCLAAKRRGGVARVVRPTGWKGGDNRTPPSGVHRCLPRPEMLALVARLES